MKINLLIITILICASQFSYSQEDGVVSLAIPVRNSLRFNKYVINPTFSFVREQNKHISFTNKREWVQFDDAPTSYLASYSGRFSENIGLGVGFFQQNYGVLTTYGGILNFAYNARIQRESNLTFGLNLGFYKSGINEGNVITNVSDPSLNNIPSNFVLSISPGINYGTAFFDFGVSINNLVQYNLTSSQLIEEDTQQGIQAHLMYTGYLDARGFFDESKFSTLVRSEFKKDKTIVSGLAMLTVPKGIWAQVGYNSVYGVSGGVGMNITTQISIEYNYEKAIGDLTTFGSSHDITLAYKFKNNNNYDYSGDDEELAFLMPEKRKKTLATSNTSTQIKERKENAQAIANAKKEEETRLVKEAEAKAKADEDARIEAEKLKEIELIAQKKKEEEARLAREAEAKAKADEDARIEAEKLKEIELIAQKKKEEEARLAREVEAKAKADEDARIEAEKLKEIELIAQKKKEEEARLAREVEAKAKADEDARIATEKLKEIELLAQAKEKARLEAEAVRLDIAQKDDLAKAMFELTEKAKSSNAKKKDLLNKLNEAVSSKNTDLKDLKEENDLSEQGIFKTPKPFKSVSAENRAIEALKLEVEETINKGYENISDIEKKYQERLKRVPNKNDETNKFYQDEIDTLKDEQEKYVRYKTSLVSRLEELKKGLEFERNRRIKRAVYDNEEDKYQKDRAALNQIKQNTEVNSNPYNEEDFDFGEERLLDNIQIVKNVKHAENGYYVVLAVHNDKAKRNEFLTKTIATGQANVNFFYDVNSSKYFIYYEKFNSINEAKQAIQLNDDKPYNSKMSIVKIEN